MSGRALLLLSAGPFTVLRDFDMSPEERARALDECRALSVVEQLARDVRAGERAQILRLLALLPRSPVLSDLWRTSYGALVDPVRRAVRERQVLFLPGWHWARAEAATAVSQAKPAADDAAAPPASARRAPPPKQYDLLFEYVTDTGHPVTDEGGFELWGPGGFIEKGKLSNGRVHRKGVVSGQYELRVRALTSARWSTLSTSPFEPVRLTVRTKNLPDGTPLVIAIRPAHAAPDAASIRLQVKVQADCAAATWSYEQAVGGRLREDFEFEVTLDKKRATSQVLRVVPHPPTTPRGAQERLRALGYDPGPAADEPTASLRAALQRYQEDHPPLVPSGELDPFTVDVLDSQIA
jgi:hypothetical protein